MPDSNSPALEPWQWPDSQWRAIVDKVRAGRSLKPTAWKGNSKCAVAISFDSDHDTIPLRDGTPRRAACRKVSTATARACRACSTS